MKIVDLLRMSLGSLWKRKVRTILTVLGVVIGTTSIVVMISLGIGMKEAMLEQMESYGSLTAVTVTKSNRWDSGDSKTEEKFLDEALIQTLMELPHVESVEPELSVNVMLKCGIYEGSMELIGIPRDSKSWEGITLERGHMPEQGDELQLVFGNLMPAEFVNSKTGRYEYWETGEAPDIDLLNDTIYIIYDTSAYYQAGSVGADGQIAPMPKKYIVSAAGLVEGGLDNWNTYSYGIYCDLDILKEELSRVFRGKVIPGQPTQKSGKPYREIFYTQLTVNVEDMQYVTEVQELITDMGYNTYADAEWIASEMQSMNIIQAVLGGIGAVALLVAAIGITNTMMMSIYERTKEIGIMKVIGCRVRDIQTLFLVEAGYIGLIGGALGVGISYLLSMVINRLLSESDALGFGAGASISRIPLWLCGIAIVFAVLIAMLAGFFPSLRAMKLSPLAAIRAE